MGTGRGRRQAEGIHRALTTTLESDYGEGFRYSDINYILLGALIENITGEAENVYVQQHVFAPLGMEETRYLPPAKACGSRMMRGAAIAWAPAPTGPVDCPAGTWSTGPDTELVAGLRELGGIPDALLDNPELLAMQLPTLRADLAVNETYRHVAEPPLEVPVTAFGGDRDPKVGIAELRAWARTTRAGFRASVLPGGHFFIAGSRNRLLAELCGDLGRSPAPGVPGRGAT